MAHSLIRLNHFSHQSLVDFFRSCESFEQAGERNLFSQGPSDKAVALVFFEPSTRTRLSFERACQKLGWCSSVFEGSASSSLSKGESLFDTVANIGAMGFDGLVLRTGKDVDIDSWSQMLPCGVMNAGWGHWGHPTQALLDWFTLWKLFDRDLRVPRLLLLGDTRYSRVAGSHVELANAAGLELGICSPDSFLAEPSMGRVPFQRFLSVNEGLQWANAVMPLRWQRERHSDGAELDFQQGSFQLTSEAVKGWSNNGLILHPGPVNWGVEMEESLKDHPQSHILDQVTNGVSVRAVLMRELWSK